MYSPPFVPPLYCVKRGNELIFRILAPSLLGREGVGGEFMK